MMTSRERVLTALNHEEPDRVPLFLGATGATSMMTPLYEKFKKRFKGLGEEKVQPSSSAKPTDSMVILRVTHELTEQEKKSRCGKVVTL